MKLNLIVWITIIKLCISGQLNKIDITPTNFTSGNKNANLKVKISLIETP